jgi:hypothetical protein
MPAILSSEHLSLPVKRLVKLRILRAPARQLSPAPNHAVRAQSSRPHSKRPLPTVRWPARTSTAIVSPLP